jgi:peptidoglycan/LPS O-acetylase OafA/YrhL
MNFRPEIEGLRAFAVLPVIFFHAGFKTFSGGYVGVDVFFVISGFLITSIILGELERDKFSIINFYERRARRILPALFLVMLVCIPFAWFWLLPGDMKKFSQSLIFASLFSSNIFFWYEGGYFDALAELKPLIHTWSLAVEGQFYILLPLFLMLFWKLGKNWILVALALVFVASLILAQWGASIRPVETFYLFPTRVWELLVGVFASFYLSKFNQIDFGKKIREVGGWLGFILVIFAVFAYNKSTPFFGLYALIPTLGTLLIILFATQKTTVGKFLGNKIFVSIGTISYGAYLWHQPLFAFARQKSFHESSHVVFLILSVLALFLAYISWRFVELPFRRKKFSSSKIFFFTMFVSTAIIVIGLFGSYNNGFKHRSPKNIVWDSLGQKLEAKGDICLTKDIIIYSGVTACEFGAKDGNKSIVLYGDSHAQALSEYLNLYFLEKNIKGIKVVLSGCHIIPNIVNAKQYLKKNNNCEQKFRSLISFIKDKNSDVIVISRWSFGLYPIKGYIEDMPYKNSEGGVENEDYREYAVLKKNGLEFDKVAKKTAVIDFINSLLESNQKIFFIYPVPEIAWDIAKMNWNFYKREKSILKNISIPISDFDKRNKFVTDIFDSFVGRKNFYPIKPSEVFCDTFIKNRCVAQYNTEPFYYDNNHLSEAGSRLLIDRFLSIVVQ